MKYFIISTLFTSLFIFHSCDVKTSGPPSENKSKNSSVISIKPKLARYFSTIDTTITFNNHNILFRITQKVVPDEATKVLLKNDSIYCNQYDIDILIDINDRLSVRKSFNKLKYELLLDEHLSSVVWGHKGIDSVTSSGIYLTTILYKPIIKKYYNIQFVCDLSGEIKINHIFDNILGENDSLFSYELNRKKVKINKNYPYYYFYLYTTDDSLWTKYDSISIVDDKKHTIQNIYFQKTQIAENDYKIYRQWAYGLEFLDINFDGYMDFRIFTNAGSRNYFFDFWLFNPKSKRFIYNSKMSNIANLEVDTVKRLLQSYFDSGNDEYSIKSYKVYNQTLILQEKEKLYGVYENDGKKIERKYLIKENYKRVDGRLVLISKKRMTNEEFLNN